MGISLSMVWDSDLELPLPMCWKEGVVSESSLSPRTVFLLVRNNILCKLITSINSTEKVDNSLFEIFITREKGCTSVHRISDSFSIFIL